MKGFLSAIPIVAAATLALAPSPAVAQAVTDTSARDGRHDFDFNIGRWRTHLRRLDAPLTGSTKWIEYEGTSVVRPLLGGDANIVELDVAGAGGRIEGVLLRIYDTRARQWTMHYASRRGGQLTAPLVGEFRGGRGEFHTQEVVNGRTILVRFVISDFSRQSAKFEQAYSADGGKTWEVNWIAVDTRMADTPP
ncbi:MAG: hypothetical protein ACREOK_13370 [Gemmatimonadaceae bacterium]